MSPIKYQQALLFLGLCVLFSGCSTSGHNDYSDSWYKSSDEGLRYLLGRGVVQNNTRAFYYFKKAANEEDEPFAQNEVAYLYAVGKGTKQDYKKALVYYKKAAKHGLISAQYNLGLMYLYGLGTNADKKIALQWFKQSADKGFEPAKQALSQYS